MHLHVIIKKFTNKLYFNLIFLVLNKGENKFLGQQVDWHELNRKVSQKN